MQKKLQRYGLLGTVYLQTLKAFESLLGLKILRGVYVERPEAAFLECPPGYAGGFLTAGQLRKHAQQPITELSAGFLDRAIPRGDECYAICAGEELAAYGWYARHSTPIGVQDLVLHFSDAYVYMYKGFTDARHRGQRLHAIGMTCALERYLGAGYRGLVSYVEATNLDSLKSCARMGYEVFGSIYVLRLFGRSFAFSSPGCSRFGFRLRRGLQPAPDLTFGKS
jgi:hypothetical protein